MKLPSYKNIIELLKKGSTIEAQEKIMELREAALEYKEETLNLKDKIIQLQKIIIKLESFEGEPCPKCRKPAWAVESSEPDKDFGEVGGIRRNYRCNECGFEESQLVTPNGVL
jgi:hypothetical protein